MFDPLLLAIEYAEILYVLAKAPDHSLMAAQKILINIFPWLAGYDIHRDGNALRWLAMHGHNPELNIVFPNLLLARRQVRDWIIAYVKAQQGEGPTDQEAFAL